MENIDESACFFESSSSDLVTFVYYQMEQHAFLALYTNGGFDVSNDAHIVRSNMCSDEWICFSMTLLSSSDEVTKKYAYAALQSLRGVLPTTPSTPSDVSPPSQRSSKRSGSSTRLQTAVRLSQNAYLYSYLLNPIGLETFEDKKVVEAFSTAKLPFHILLRPGRSEEDIEKALVKLPLGTKLAVVDVLRDFRN